MSITYFYLKCWRFYERLNFKLENLSNLQILSWPSPPYYKLYYYRLKNHPYINIFVLTNFPYTNIRGTNIPYKNIVAKTFLYFEVVFHWRLYSCNGFVSKLKFQIWVGSNMWLLSYSTLNILRLSSIGGCLHSKYLNTLLWSR